MKFNNNEEAVSPVIGVILMVAITVILAAVIAVFVFGMADDIQTTHTVTATAKLSGDVATITYQGGPDANIVDYLNVTAYKSTGAVEDGTFDVSGAASGKLDALGTFKWDNAKIGETLKIATVPSQERVVIIAYFTDGTEQMILNKQF